LGENARFSLFVSPIIKLIGETKRLNRAFSLKLIYNFSRIVPKNLNLCIFYVDLNTFFKPIASTRIGIKIMTKKEPFFSFTAPGGDEEVGHTYFSKGI
jgi:hypothetical protein